METRCGFTSRIGITPTLPKGHTYFTKAHTWVLERRTPRISGKIASHLTTPSSSRGIQSQAHTILGSSMAFVSRATIVRRGLCLQSLTFTDRERSAHEAASRPHAPRVALFDWLCSSTTANTKGNPIQHASDKGYSNLQRPLS